MAKIIQIACGTDGDDDSVSHDLYALDDNGVVYRLQQAQPARKNGIPKSVGRWSAYWKKLPALDEQAPRFTPDKGNENVGESDLAPPSY